MINKLVRLILMDLDRTCTFLVKTTNATHGMDSKYTNIEGLYNTNRNRLLDLIREISLGEQPNWDEINAIMPSMTMPKN